MNASMAIGSRRMRPTEPVIAAVVSAPAVAPRYTPCVQLKDCRTTGTVVDRRPPLAISHDAGETWREAGGGLPAGFAVAIADDDPDRMLYAARNRLYVSANGGVFWRGLAFELPDVVAVSWID